MSGLVGQTYVVQPGVWTGVPTPVLSFQWQHDNTAGVWLPITGASGTAYTIASGDAGHQVRCAVTGSNSAGSSTGFSNAVGIVGAPINTTLPVVTGTYVTGQTIHCDPGLWSAVPDPTYGFQWQRDTLVDGVFVNLAGHVFQNYLVEPETVGCALRCVVTATNTAGTGVAQSVAVGPVTVPAAVPVQSDLGMMGVGV